MKTHTIKTYTINEHANPGGYWTIEQDGETIENWATSDEVREYIAEQTLTQVP